MRTDADNRAAFAAFAADLAPTGTVGDLVIRSGLLFKAGDHTDMFGVPFAMTEAELDEAAAEFTSAPLEIEHATTVFGGTLLDGHLGNVIAVRADKGALYGTAAIPKWLDSLFPGQKMPVSCVFGRETKRIHRVGIVKRPGITDAALEAAFAGRRHSASDAADLQTIHDLSLKQGAECPPPPAADGSHLAPVGTGWAMGHSASFSASDSLPTPEVKRPMNRLEQFISWLKGEDATPPPGAGAEAQMSAKPPPAPAPPAADPRIAELEARIAASDKLIADERRARLEDRAVAFAARVRHEKRALPKDTETNRLRYLQAALDDAAYPTEVAFAAGAETKKGTRVEALEAEFAARTPHSLDRDLTAEELARAEVLFSKVETGPAEGGKMTPEREEELLRGTPLGEVILADRRANGGGK